MLYLDHGGNYAVKRLLALHAIHTNLHQVLGIGFQRPPIAKIKMGSEDLCVLAQVLLHISEPGMQQYYLSQATEAKSCASFSILSHDVKELCICTDIDKLPRHQVARPVKSSMTAAENPP